MCTKQQTMLNNRSSNNYTYVAVEKRPVMLRYFLALVLLIVHCQCTEMQIISEPNYEQIKAINLMKSLRRYRKRIINLNNDTYTCITAIKQKPTDLSSNGTDKAKLTAQYISGNIPTAIKADPTLYENSLQLLNDGIGVRHYTRQFIYGYKHKRIVSQYDDDTTKLMNQKKQLENFTMGLFSVSLSLNQKTQTGNKVQLQYRTYQNSHNFNPNPKVPVNQMKDKDTPLSLRQSQYAKSIVHIDYENALLTLSKPLKKQRHIRSATYNVTLKCYLAEQEGIRQQNYSRTIIGLSLTNYQIITIHPIPKDCFQVTQIVKSENWVLALNQDINIFDDKLTGDLDRFCSIRYDNGINIGDYLLLETQRIVQNSKKVVDIFVIKIEQVIGQNFYLMDKKLPWTLKPIRCKKLAPIPHKRLDYTGHIDIKEVQVPANEKIINFESHRIIEFSFTGSRLIKISKASQASIKTGLQLFCLTKIALSISPQNPIFHNVGVTVGRRFSSDYYEIHPWISYNRIKKFNQIGEFLGKTICIPYKQSQILEQQTNKKFINSISTTVKISKNVNSKIKIDQNSQKLVNKKISHQKIDEDSIFIFTLSKDAVIQVTTSVNEPIQLKEQANNQNIQEKQKTQRVKQIGNNKYYLSGQKLYKIETLNKNGTKIRVERLQNEFYENNTNQNMIILYRSIWRAGDFVKFPRFLFHPQEKITGIIVKHGTAFLRIVNLAKMDRQVYAVSSSSLTDKKYGFGPRVRPQKSTATQFKFLWGTFCPSPINKNRETQIKIKCGHSWFKINSVVEISPCSYEINIVSQFLCDQKVIFPALKQGFSVFNGSLCISSDFYNTM